MARGRLWTSTAIVLACAAADAGAALGAHSGRTTLPRFPAIAPYSHRADFSSGGRSVRAALCRPAGSASVPAVVVLHGCGGFGLRSHIPAELRVYPHGTHEWKGRSGWPRNVGSMRSSGDTWPAANGA